MELSLETFFTNCELSTFLIENLENNHFYKFTAWIHGSFQHLVL